jgi:hypothetical protein
MTKPNNLSELLIAAADALDVRDNNRMQELIDVNDNWMQTDEEHDAQHTLLKTMLGTIYDLHRLDNE